MNITQLTALCLRHQGILLDADNEVVHVAVVDSPSHELLDALHFATTKRIDIVCWTRQQMEGHMHKPRKMLPAVIADDSRTAAELCSRRWNPRWQNALPTSTLNLRKTTTESGCAWMAYFMPCPACHPSLARH